MTSLCFRASRTAALAIALTSGGFLQLRYHLPRATFLILRYDGVNDTSGNFSRSLTIAASRLISAGFRLEVHRSASACRTRASDQGRTELGSRLSFLRRAQEDGEGAGELGETAGGGDSPGRVPRQTPSAASSPTKIPMRVPRGIVASLPWWSES